MLPEVSSGRLEAARASADLGVRLGAVLETTKPRITRLVTITAGVGFAMGALGRNWSPGLMFALVGCLVGTALAASGANALNQWMERDRDALMRRTRSRPLPSGRLLPGEVLFAGGLFCAFGLVVLWLAAGPVPMLVCLATILSYLFLYTPLKPVTPQATLVGAVPGALPPLIGWTAAYSWTSAGSWGPFYSWGMSLWGSAEALAALMSPAGWSLFLLMFVWQVPHTLAISWMYKEDYAAGGYRVLPVVDPSGRSTAAAILVWSVCLVPVTLAPVLFMPELLGGWYVAAALIGGAAFVFLAARAAVTRARGHAKAAFIASVIHLPILMIVMVAEGVAMRVL